MTDSTYVFGAADAKISPLLTDGSPAPTYGTAIDVPGLQSIEISGENEVKELRGDNRSLVKLSVLQSVEVTLTFAKWDADLYALFTGATKTTDGDSYTVTLGADSQPGFFSLEAVSAGASGANSNVSIFLPKLVVTEMPGLGLAEEDFQTVEITCEALPTATGDWISWSYNDTALDLDAPAPEPEPEA